MNKPTFFFLTSLLSSSLIAGENLKVRFPEDNAAWVANLTFSTPPALEPATSPEAPPVAEVRPEKIEYTAVGGTQRYRVTWSDRKTTEVWKLRGLTLVQDRVAGVIGCDGASLVPGYVIALDASLFAWIREATPGQNTLVDQRACVLYETAAKPGEMSPGNISDDYYARRAWIDLEAKLPLAYDNGIVLYRFTYLPTPTTPLTLPAEFGRVMETILAATTQPPAWAKRKN